MKEKLQRSRINRVFGGVASGLARYLNLDVILVRVLFVVLTLVSGFGLLLYVILWIVVPEEEFTINYGSTAPPPPNENSSANSGESKEFKFNSGKQYDIPPFEVKKSNGSGRLVVGIIFIGLGFLFLADRIFPYLDFDDFFPLIFVIIGIALIWNSIKK